MAKAVATQHDGLVDFNGVLAPTAPGKVELIRINLSFGNMFSLCFRGIFAFVLASCLLALVFSPVLFIAWRMFRAIALGAH